MVGRLAPLTIACAVLALAVASGTACQAIFGIGATSLGGSGDGGTPDVPFAGDDAASGAGFSISTQTMNLTVVRAGDVVIVDVQVVRAPGFHGDVVLSVANLPPGVLCPAVTVRDGHPSGPLAFSALSTATLGPGTGTLKGTSGDETHTVPLVVTVADPPGTIDTTFGTNGSATVQVFGADDFVSAMALDADHNIVVGVQAMSGAIPYIGLVRLTPDGALDMGFGSGGVAVGPRGYTNSVAIDSSGRILVAGIGTGSGLVMRFDSGGHPDPMFGNGTGPDAGVPNGTGVYTNIDAASANGLALQSTGKIVFAAVQHTPTSELCRLLPNGGLDTTFGTSGCSAPVTSGALYDGVVLGKNDEVYAAGSVMTTGNVFYVAHTDPDGKDHSREYAYATPGCIAESLAIDGSEALLAGGCGGWAGLSLAGDHAPDTSFGDGLILTNIFGVGTSSLIAVALDSGGRIVAAGNGTDTMGARGAVLRWSATGDPDTKFGQEGVAPVRPAPGQPANLSCMIIAPDGRILVGGSEPNSGIIMRLWP